MTIAYSYENAVNGRDQTCLEYCLPKLVVVPKDFSEPFQISDKHGSFKSSVLLPQKCTSLRHLYCHVVSSNDEFAFGQKTLHANIMLLDLCC